MKNIKDVTVSDILQVYTGRRVGCMCGCNGDYRCTKESKQEASKHCGHEATVNDRQVKKVLQIFQDLDPSYIEQGEDYFYTEVSTGHGNDKCYAIYLCKSAVI